jgi:molybdopterin molybdotransferase
MRSLEEAAGLVAAATPGPLPAEPVPLAAALGRFAAEAARSAVDLPPFDRSAMDGYAVRAGELNEGPLRLAGLLAAGDPGTMPLEPGTALTMTTGSPIPPGADAILQSEHAIVHDGTVRSDRPLEPGRHIRRRGEDLHAGDVLVEPGQRLGIHHITSLASAGVGEVSVHRAARVHVITTGSELLPVGAPPEPGKVHESNGITLALLCARAGAQVTDHGVVPDDPAAIRAAVERGLEQSDVLLVTGGVSVGPHDHVKPTFEALGVEEVFWRVRIKPGKPLWFGRRGGTLVFGLPGNPLSSLVGFLAFIEPALRRLHGESAATMRTVPARLTGEAGPSDGRTTFYTATLRPGPDGVLEASPTERQGSHMTGALGASDGFVIVAGTIAAGELAPAIQLV